jgi:excisionase family DNA binding protein
LPRVLNPRQPRRLTEPLPPLLRYSEAADLIGTSERHIYNLVATGALQRAKIGARAVRVVTASLLRLIEQRSPEPPRTPETDTQTAAA